MCDKSVTCKKRLGINLIGFNINIGKGVPWYWVIAACVLLVIGVLVALRTIPRMIFRRTFGKPLPQKVEVIQRQQAVSDQRPAQSSVMAGRVVQTSVVTDSNKVYCTGFSAVPPNVLVFLSDGRVAESRDGEVQNVSKRQVVCFGQQFEVKPNYPPPIPVEPLSGRDSLKSKELQTRPQSPRLLDLRTE